MTLAPLKSRSKAPPDPARSRPAPSPLAASQFTDIGRGPSILNRGWRDDRMMGLTLTDPAVKVQLFRFIDALPALTTPEAVVGHLAEYVHQVGDGVPRWLRAAVDLARRRTFRGEILAAARRGPARGAHGQAVHRRLDADRGVPRPSTPSAAAALAFTADLLGEACVSEHEAEQYQRKYLDLINNLPGQVAGWKPNPRLESDHLGPIPRTNVSIKISSLSARVDPIDTEGSIRELMKRIVPILEAAKAKGVFVNFDMEQFALKDLTLELVPCGAGETEDF